MNDDDFESADLASAVEALPLKAIDQLPFGCIRLDGQGIVQFYSVREGELSGRGSLPTVGLPFFTAVAPCMDNPAVKGRIDAAIANGKLDADILHVGDFSDRDRPLRIRAQSASGGGVWLFLQREAA